MTGTPTEPTRLDPLLLGFPILALLLQILSLPAYGWFRDEFYYIACSEHPAFGYVDHPPLSVFVLWLWRAVFGSSIWAVRLLPALAQAVTVIVVGRIALGMGGQRYAQALAMLAAVCAPAYLAMAHVYSMNAFDTLFWAVTALLLTRILNGAPQRTWVVLGVVLGLGLQNKISVLWLGAGLFVGLVATGERRHFATPGPWITGLVALALFLPHIVWQIANDWPTLEFMANARSDKMVALEIVPFLAAQVLFIGPPSVWLWLGGLAWLFRSGGARYRLLAWVWLTVLVILVGSGSARPSYMSASYTWLLAAGAVATERFLSSARRERFRPAAVALVASTLLLAPMAIPLLPIESYIAYAQRLGVAPRTEERKELAELPQFYADMQGWKEIVDTVAEVHGTLSPEEQTEAVVFTLNYGVAGAVDFLGRERGLPRAASGHNNYWLWGPGEPASTVLIVGGNADDHRQICGRLDAGAVIDCGYCMPYENGNTVWICRDLRRPIEEIWPQLRNYD
jgi:hypothetical protein